MSTRTMALILGGLTLLLVLPPSLHSTEPTAAPAPTAAGPDLSAQRQTVSDLRNVGTAMFHWWQDAMIPKRSEAATQAAEEFAKKASQTDMTADMSDVPTISRAELETILVPKYIAAVPEKDAWGHPYEYRLDTRNANSLHAMALRSAGQDGKFSGETYKIEGFRATDQKQDLAWMDGYFIRWPEAGK